MLLFIQIVNFLFQIYTVMLFMRIISSWIPRLSEYRLMQYIFALTDPYLNLFRRFIPPMGMLDFSPVVAFLCLSFIQKIVLNFLIGFL